MLVSYRVEKWRQYHSPNAAMLRHLLTTEGYDVFQWSDPPGMSYASHMHSDDQSHWVVSGSLEIALTAGGTYVLEAGDRDFMPAGTYHSARVLGEEGCFYLVGSKKPEKPKKKRGRPSVKKEIDEILRGLERFRR